MNITSLSPSMVQSYIKCSWGFQYEHIAKLPRISKPVLAIGSAVHETIRENAYQKVRTAKDLPESLLTDFVAEDIEYRDVDWSTQSLSSAKDQAVVCVKAYRQKMAPKVQPFLVEWTFNMKVVKRDWNIAGKVDLITNKNLVIDHKTTKGQMAKPKPDHVFQLGVYTLAVRQQAGLDDVQGQIDYYPRGKPDAYSRSVEFGEGLAKEVLSTFDQVATGIQREVWIANRQHYLCSRKYCSFWNQCEKDCGGRVRD